MQRYPEYKESGVEWIGEIATCPEATRLKYICELIVDCEHKTAPTQETGYPLIRTPNIGIGYLILDGVNRVSEEIYQEWSRRTIPQSGDLILAREAPVGNVAIIPKDLKVCLGQRTVLIRPDKNKVCSIFLVYLMLGDETQTRLLGRSTGATVHHLNMTDIRNLELPILPPLPVQTQIAAFLDRKTGQIDELLRIKERRIELLQEQRTTLINQAVTKGLDPNVEMKPSGVEWIGEIPAHWKIIKLRYLGVLQNGISKDSDSFGLGYPFLSYGDVYNNDTLPTQVEGLVKSTKADKERYSVKETDVFFTRTSETIEEIGISSTCMKTIENCVFSGFLIRFRNTSTVLTKKFSKYYFPSHLPRIFLAREVNIVTRSSLSQELLKRLPVLLPSPDEQKEIANFLDLKTKQIDELIAAEQRKIELLKEYRQSLISEAVTGKIDVRSEV